MSEEDLDLLVTLDDPGEEEDALNHLQAGNTLEASSHNDTYQVTFGQGDWTCTLSRLSGTTNHSMKGINGDVIQGSNKEFDIEVCTVTRCKNGEIIEQKVFFDLVGLQKQIQVM